MALITLRGVQPPPHILRIVLLVTNKSMNEIITGDARQLAKYIPDGSIDLIFTDPIYDRLEDYKWLLEIGERLLKSTGNVLAFTNAKWLSRLLVAVPSPHPPLAYVMTSGASPMNGRVIAKTHYVVWWGSGKIPGYIADGYIGTTWSKPNGHNHKWTKSPKYLSHVLTSFTQVGATVYDPFCGGGSIVAVCKMLERRFIASEIDGDVAQMARQRLSETQPPLPEINEVQHDWDDILTDPFTKSGDMDVVLEAR